MVYNRPCTSAINEIAVKCLTFNGRHCKCHLIIIKSEMRRINVAGNRKTIS